MGMGVCEEEGRTGTTRGLGTYTDLELAVGELGAELERTSENNRNKKKK
jgi:hypothetical protein